MFSYSFKIRKLNKPGSKLKAFVTIAIDNLIEIHGFKIIEGSNGLFVTPPSHKGTVMEEGVPVEKYFDDVTFLGDEGIEVSKEIKQSIISEYTSGGLSQAAPSRADSAKAHIPKPQVSKPQSSKSEDSTSEPSEPARDRKPLWGF